MLPQTKTRLNEPIHLLALRSIIYSVALGAAVWPAASIAVSIAVAAAGLLGVIAGRQVAASPLRTWVVVAGGLGVAVTGAIISHLLGSLTWFAHAVGLSGALSWTQGIALALGAIGVIVPLRVVSLRYRPLALLEVAVAAAVVVFLFAGHRDYELGNPRFLSDWAFSTGRNPWTILLMTGMATLGGVVFFLLPRQKASRNLAAVLMLFCLIGGFYFLFVGGSENISGGTSGGADNDERKLNYDDAQADDSDKKKPVFLLVFHDAFTPIDGQYHVRRNAFSELKDSRLAVPTIAGANDDVPTQFPSATVNVPIVEMSAEFARDVRTTMAMITPMREVGGLTNLSGLAPEANPDPKYFVTAYGVRSRVLAPKNKTQLNNALLRATAGNPSWTEELRQHYLQVPNAPRYKELADKLLREAQANGSLPAQWARSPYAQQAVIAKWIRENTIYSLSSGNGDLPDPIIDYLFESRKGKCTHYATAMAYLLRTQGIPTRVASGFAAPLERRGQSSSMLFLKGDAHAWCEIYLDQFGWVALDGGSKNSEEPTPPSPSEEMKNSVSNKYNSKKDKDHTAEVVAPEKDKPSEVGMSIGLKVVLAILPLIFGLYSVKIWRWLAPRYAATKQLYRVVYRATLDRLAEVGLIRQFGETREQFAQRLGGFMPEFADFTQHHLRGAMGASDNLGRPGWLTMQNQVEARLPENFSRTRRIVGYLNPVSWLQVQ